MAAMQLGKFGMKAHIGVDADSGMVHTVRGTAANVNDVVEGNILLHGEETDVFADIGHQGDHKRPDAREGTTWHVAMRPGAGQDRDLMTPKFPPHFNSKQSLIRNVPQHACP